MQYSKQLHRSQLCDGHMHNLKLNIHSAPASAAALPSQSSQRNELERRSPACPGERGSPRPCG